MITFRLINSFFDTMKNPLFTSLIAICFIAFSFIPATGQTADDIEKIIYKAENKLRGKSSISQMKITTIRARYTREMRIKSWTQGEDLSLMYIMEPDRDKGTTYLKRNKEIWYYLPSIERNIKMPPSMMNQSWMGTDLSNDDLVKKNSLSKDFDHTLIAMESISEKKCYHIKLIPHENADVIWWKIELWIEKENFNVMKQESFDEDMELVNTMLASDIKNMGGEIIPSKMQFFPADKPNQKTLMEYESIEFDVTIPSHYFTTQYMTKIKA